MLNKTEEEVGKIDKRKGNVPGYVESTTNKNRNKMHTLELINSTNGNQELIG